MAEKKGGGCTGCLGKVALVFVALVVLGVIFGRKGPGNRAEPGSTPVADARSSVSGLLPEVASFLASHGEFGRPLSASPVPNWAQGKRQNVNFDTGRTLLFYERGGEIVTVYDNTPSHERKVVWGEASGTKGMVVAEIPIAAGEQVKHGLDLARRKEIYVALWAADKVATKEAGEKFPFDDAPTEAAAAGRYLKQRNQLYEGVRKKGRGRIVGKYKVDGATLDAIEKEGNDHHWPGPAE